MAAGFGGARGANSVTWDGRDARGQPVAPGSYVAVLLAKQGARVDRKTIPLQARLSPEAQAAGLSGPGSSGTAGGSPAGGSTSAGGTNTTPGSGTTAPGTGTHDNGIPNGKNPKDFPRGSNPGEHKGGPK